MRNASSAILLAMACLSGSKGIADPSDIAVPNDATVNQTAPFIPFTGKVLREKVRLRVQPLLDSPILKEMNRGDLVLILGETEEFYALQPPTGTKAYVFRTFILDNTVEGNHVNVRLEPSVDAPVIGQLNSGEIVQGTVSSRNNKWLEIAPPATARFYVSKDYVEKIGDKNLLATLERRRQEADQILNSTIAFSQKEMQKSYNEIHFEVIYQNLNRLMNDYQDFPQHVAKAKSMQLTLQDVYLKKKVVYLEDKARHVDNWQTQTSTLQAELQAQQQRYTQLQQKITATPPPVQTVTSSWSNVPSTTQAMQEWIPSETVVFEHWQTSQPDLSWDDFYTLQHQNAVSLKGVVEPYTRSVKNKPGDFVLISKLTNLPIAYLYSTKVNLLEKVGQEVMIEGYSRPNNNFAYPAYFVLSIE